MPAIDYLVETPNPAALDLTLQQLGACLHCLEGNFYPKNSEGYYTMRIFGSEGYVKFAIEQQGYCKIIRKLDALT
jgi:hypothetical protein